MLDLTGMTVPDHIAIIMDGNGRWARARGLPRVAGHQKGAESVQAVIRASAKLNVKYLTLYSFSSENWKRPEEEVSALMSLLSRYLKSEIKEIHKHNIRFKVIGNRSRLPKKIQKLIDESESLTSQNHGLTLCLALSYGSRDEIVDTVRQISQKVAQNKISLSDISEDLFDNFLQTNDMPDPDLVIRTSGEMRVSNFLLWQLAYSELYFTNTLWPDFTEADLKQAIIDYNNRDRRYGAVANDCI